jgi:hypothetical protein
VSRRRLFGLLGGAAAAGAGLAVAGSMASEAPAGADGPNVLLANGTGGTGNNAGAVATSITSTATSTTLQAQNSNNSPQLSLTGATGAGHPTGTHSAGDMFVDSNGDLWFAFSGGNPASWIPLTLPPFFGPFTPGPVRVYDSRFGIAPFDVQKGQLTPGEERTIDLTHNNAVNFSGAYAALINLTVANTSSVGFLAVYAANVTNPGHSNINWFTSGQVTANNASTLFDNMFRIKAFCGLAPTDLIIDVFGLYLA